MAGRTKLQLFRDPALACQKAIPTPPKHPDSRQELPEMELFHQSLEALPLILRGLGREKRLSPEELEDLRSDIQIKLLEDDYRVLRRWNRRSSFKVYLKTVVYNVWHDRVRGEKGTVRVSAAASRLGPAAKEFEILIGRQGLKFDEAYQVIKPRFPGLSRGEAEEIAAQINPRRGRHFDGVDVVAWLQDLEPTGDKLLEQQEKLVKKHEALALMDRILSELPEQDRMLLVAAHAEGVKFSRIARSLGIDQVPLYRRNERLLKKLRTDLEEAGIRWEDLSEVLGIDETLFHRQRRFFECEMLLLEPTGNKRLEQQKKLLEKRRALALMDRILSELPEQDRMLFVAAHVEGVKLSCIARSLGIDQVNLYRRNERLLKKLRTDLEEAGIRMEDLSEVLGIDESPETPPRVSAAAKRLGPPAPELEYLLMRQGFSFDEAYQAIKPHFPGLSRVEAEEIMAQLTPRPALRLERLIVRDEALMDPPVPSGIPMVKIGTCITPADLAAFLEGSLTGEERDRMVRHLSHCSDCLERYIGAARLLDAIEEEEASALSAADGNRAVEPSLLRGVEILKKLPRRSWGLAWLLRLLRLAVPIL